MSNSAYSIYDGNNIDAWTVESYEAEENNVNNVSIEDTEEAHQFVKHMCMVYDLRTCDIVAKDVLCHAYVENYPKENLMDVLSMLYGLHEHIVYMANDQETKERSRRFMDEYEHVVTVVDECPEHQYMCMLKHVGLS